MSSSLDARSSKSSSSESEICRDRSDLSCTMRTRMAALVCLLLLCVLTGFLGWHFESPRDRTFSRRTTQVPQESVPVLSEVPNSEVPNREKKDEAENEDKKPQQANTETSENERNNEERVFVSQEAQEPLAEVKTTAEPPSKDVIEPSLEELKKKEDEKKKEEEEAAKKELERKKNEAEAAKNEIEKKKKEEAHRGAHSPADDDEEEKEEAAENKKKEDEVNERFKSVVSQAEQNMKDLTAKIDDIKKYQNAMKTVKATGNPEDELNKLITEANDLNVKLEKCRDGAEYCVDGVDWLAERFVDGLEFMEDEVTHLETDLKQLTDSVNNFNDNWTNSEVRIRTEVENILHAAGASA